MRNKNVALGITARKKKGQYMKYLYLAIPLILVFGCKKNANPVEPVGKRPYTGLQMVLTHSSAYYINAYGVNLLEQDWIATNKSPYPIDSVQFNIWRINYVGVNPPRPDTVLLSQDPVGTVQPGDSTVKKTVYIDYLVTLTYDTLKYY
jgi:hypothetical protein